MPNNDSHQHVVKTSAQWNERAIEYWVVPRGCLCVELTPRGKTKIKVGEGDKNYYQLPYIFDHDILLNYYTKEEVDNLFNNLNRMAIMSTDEYDSRSDLPHVGNKLGDVRFVKSASPSIKIDPDMYVWNGTKWIFVGNPMVDLTPYVTKEEFNVVKGKVDEIYPKAHTHDNKELLDNITQADRDKFDDLHNYDDTEIRDLINRSTHTHPNKDLLDTIMGYSILSYSDRVKLDNLHNYDDTEVKVRLVAVEEKAHVHRNKAVLDGITQEKLDEIDELAATYTIVRNDITDLKSKSHVHPNKDILDGTTAAYTVDQQRELQRVSNIDIFIGAGPTWNGVFGYVPAPEQGQQTFFLRADGTWSKVKSGGDKYKAGEGIYILSGETTSDSFPFQVYSRAGHLEQYIIYGNTGGVGDAMVGGMYGVNITVTDEHGNSSNTSVILPEKISLGDYIDYGKQVFVHMRTDVSSLLGNIDPAYSQRWAIYPDGSIQPKDLGSYGTAPQVTSLVELEPGVTYELYHLCTYTDFEHYMNLNVYDTGQNRTRTINFYETTGNVPTIIALGSNEKYIRVTYGPLPTYYTYTLIRVKAVETPITLPQIPLFPNSINTINVTNTIKPAEIYVEVAEPSEDDPEDPMSEYTGIIYNDGVIDVEQDETDLNTLIFHYRDEVTKSFTIPGGGGGGSDYLAGTGIRILSDEVRGTTFPLHVYANGVSNAVDYTLTAGSHGLGKVTNLYSPLTSSSVHYSDWVLDSSTFNGEPVYRRNWSWFGVSNEIYLDVGTYTFSLYAKSTDTTNAHSIYVLAATHETSYYHHLNEIAGVSAAEKWVYLTNQWERYSITFNVTRAGYVACRLEKHVDNNVSAYISCYQLERGSVATPYSHYNTAAIPITISAAGETDRSVSIELNAAMVEGESINYIEDSLVTLPLFNGKENIITVDTEYPPSEMYVLARSGAESDKTIYNTGLLSVTQDPVEINKLTFGMIDGDVEVVLPDMPDTYIEGTGISLIGDTARATSYPITIYANETAQAIDYTIYGASGNVGDLSPNIHPPWSASSVNRNMWTLDSQTYHGNQVFYRYQAWGGLASEVYLDVGIYTFSVYMKANDGTPVRHITPITPNNEPGTYPHYNQGCTISYISEHDLYPDSTWRLYSVTFEVTAAGYAYPRIERYSDGSYTYISCPQLVRGDSYVSYEPKYGKYYIPITVSAEGENDILIPVELNAPLGNGDSVNYVDDSLPALTLYQNTDNVISIGTTVDPSMVYIDANGSGSPSSVISINNLGLLSVEQDQQDLNHLTFTTMNGDIDITIPGGSGGASYVEGNGIELIGTTEVDVNFDYTAFVNSLTGAYNGTLTKNVDGSITITPSSASGSWTVPDIGGGSPLPYTFNVEPGTTYKLTWDSGDDTVNGTARVFENAALTTMYIAPQSEHELTFTTSNSCSYISIRFEETDLLPMTISNVKLYRLYASAVSINAKLGDGLHFNSDKEIALDDIYSAGQGVEFNTDFISDDTDYYFNTQVTSTLVDHSSNSRTYTKHTAQPALGAIVGFYNNDVMPWFGPMYVSTDPDAVAYETSHDATIHPASATTFQYRGLTWYFSEPDYYIQNTVICQDTTGHLQSLPNIYEEPYNDTRKIEAAKDIIDAASIYSNNIINAKLGNGLQFDANGAIEVVGGSYTASHGIEIISDDIEANLGDGLTFDVNDAITLDEATKFTFHCNNDQD